MDIIILILVGFGIVGSIESRIRPLLKNQEFELRQLKTSVERLEQKLETILGKLGDE
ncbi:MAG: hypothetical protein HUJ26_05845 [Planctomycetaceae bacterium]|nr:hypothetical protein [Planctomycetaceae bacterium]